MTSLSETEFNQIVAEGIDAIPKKYQDNLKNVAFIVEDKPSKAQRQKLNLRPKETLFGLYEGVPLPQRNGALKLLPDKITLFKEPMEIASHDLNDLKEQVRHTIWHEVAHYFGLGHQRIYELE
jgi:predicted Zn-dependent protease with MMP-like domain